jgi:hypothetical protein
MLRACVHPILQPYCMSTGTQYPVIPESTMLSSQVNIFLTIRYVPIPEVKPIERLLVEQLGVKGFYHVVARCAATSWIQDSLSA